MDVITFDDIKVTYGCIYVYHNKLNGKCYVGQTVNPEERYNAHLKAAKSDSQLHFSRALRKYGIENFEYKIIWGQMMPIECAKDNLNYWEKYYIKVFDSYNNGYNMTEGGEGCLGCHSNKGKPAWNKGIKTDVEIRQKIRKSMKEIAQTNDFKEHCANGGKKSKGYVWLYNDELQRNTKCSIDKVNYYISIGYNIGRKFYKWQ